MKPAQTTIDYALTADPSVPGAGRLCQEIIAALTGKRIKRPVVVLERRKSQRSKPKGRG